MYNTLLKLFYLSLSFSIGACFAPPKLAVFLNRTLGVPIGIALFVLFLLFVFGTIVGGILFRYLILLGLKLMLTLPPCKNNRCTSFGRDYTWSPLTLFGWVEFGHFHYRCACGDQYMRIANRFLELTFQRSVPPDATFSHPMAVTDEVNLKYYKILAKNGIWVKEERTNSYEDEYFGGKLFIFPKLTRRIILDLAEWGAWVKVAIKAEVLNSILKSHAGEPYVDIVMSELTKMDSACVKGVVMPKSRLEAYFMLDQTDRRQQEVEFFVGARSLKEPIGPVSDASFFVFPVSVDDKNILSVVDANYRSYFGAVLHPG